MRRNCCGGGIHGGRRYHSDNLSAQREAGHIRRRKRRAKKSAPLAIIRFLKLFYNIFLIRCNKSDPEFLLWCLKNSILGFFCLEWFWIQIIMNYLTFLKFDSIYTIHRHNKYFTSFDTVVIYSYSYISINTYKTPVANVVYSFYSYANLIAYIFFHL